jgi:serine/threonine protein kinase
MRKRGRDNYTEEKQNLTTNTNTGSQSESPYTQAQPSEKKEKQVYRSPQCDNILNLTNLGRVFEGVLDLNHQNNSSSSSSNFDDNMNAATTSSSSSNSKNDQIVIIKATDIQLGEVQNHLFLSNRQQQTGAPKYILPLIQPTLCNYLPSGDNQLALILPRATTDLYKYLRKIGPVRNTGTVIGDNDQFDKRLKIANSIFNAVAFLHVNNFAHMDLKPENFFIMPDNQICLADFGNSLPVIPQIDAHYNNWQSPDVVTANYRPLEIACGIYIYSPFKADIWSLGVMLGEIFFNYRLFSENVNYVERRPYDNPQNVAEMKELGIPLNEDDENNAHLKMMYKMSGQIRQNIINDLWYPDNSSSSFDTRDAKDDDKDTKSELKQVKTTLYGTEYKDSKIYDPRYSNFCYNDIQKVIMKRRSGGISELNQDEFYGDGDINKRQRHRHIMSLFPGDLIENAIKVYGNVRVSQIIEVISVCLVVDLNKRTSNIFQILGMPLFMHPGNLVPNNPEAYQSKSTLYRNFFIRQYGCTPITSLPSEHFRWDREKVLQVIYQPEEINMNVNLWNYILLLANVIGGRLNERLQLKTLRDPVYNFYLINTLKISFELFGNVINFTDNKYNNYIDTLKILKVLNNNLWQDFFIQNI